MNMIHFYNIDLILSLLVSIFMSTTLAAFVIWKITKRLVHKILWLWQQRQWNSALKATLRNRREKIVDIVYVLERLDQCILRKWEREICCDENLMFTILTGKSFFPTFIVCYTIHKQKSSLTLQPMMTCAKNVPTYGWMHYGKTFM